MPVTFLIVAIVIAVAWAAGRLAGRLGQPPVVGELAAGIVLGPSVFGLLAPDVSRSVFTADVTRAISTIATAAILVFMFLIGLELDINTLRRQARGVARIAAASLILPFTLGCLLAIWLFPSLRGEAALQVPARGSPRARGRAVARCCENRRARLRYTQARRIS